ncbi:hypothetical protein D1007_18635 [Hordeum vulgare]|nr:hypothetical protein D1007_18635 [Hordeum vulgare]
MNYGFLSPLLLLCRKIEEYDRARQRIFSATRSSCWASSSRSSLTPVKRELEELSPVCAVKREPEATTGPERRAVAVLGLEDFLHPTEADAILAAMVTRSAREEEE